MEVESCLANIVDLHSIAQPGFRNNSLQNQSMNSPFKFKYNKISFDYVMYEQSL